MMNKWVYITKQVESLRKAVWVYDSVPKKLQAYSQEPYRDLV